MSDPIDDDSSNFTKRDLAKEGVCEPKPIFAEIQINNADAVYTFEEALEKTGYGKYTWSLFFLCTFSIIAVIQEIFGSSYLVSAAACDLNLDTKIKGTLSGIPMIGIIVSAHLWGYIADTKGRKKTLLVSMGGGAVFAFLGSWSTNWIMFAVFKFIGAAFSSATNAVAYTLFGECCPKSHRNKMVLLMSTGLMATQAIMTMMAYPILNLNFDYPIGFLGLSYSPWRLLWQIYALTLLIFTILIYSFSWESPKFLLTQGRKSECLEVLQNISKSNGGKLQQFEVKDVILTEQMNSFSNKNTNIISTMWYQTIPLFRKNMIKNTMIIMYMFMIVYALAPAFVMWFPVLANVYMDRIKSGKIYGSNFCQIFTSTAQSKISPSHFNTTIHSTTDCDSHIKLMTYVFIFVFSIVTAILNTVNSYLIKYIEKKTVVIIYQTVSGIAALALNFIYLIPLSLVFLGLMCVGATCMGLCTAFAVEVYPTYFRGMAICLMMMAGRGVSFFTIQLLGIFLENYCEATLFAAGIAFFSSVAVAFLLPSDKKLANILENTSKGNTTE